MELSVYEDTNCAEIQALFMQTFSDSDGHSEGQLVGSLVLKLMQETETADMLGFIARENKEIIGSIFFTRLSFEVPVEAYLLSPVGVATSQQGKMVGQRLINFGLARLKEQAANLVFTYGDPNFYSKVGFGAVPETFARAPYALSQPQGWLYQSLDGTEITALPGSCRCVSAFANPDYW